MSGFSGHRKIVGRYRNRNVIMKYFIKCLQSKYFIKFEDQVRRDIGALK